MTEKQLENRKRCLACSYYGMNRCPEMMDGDVFNIDTCVLEDIIKNKGWNAEGPEMFMFKNNPEIFLKYLSYLRKNKLPKPGTKVLTLRSGFSGPAGVIRYVSHVSNEYIELETPEGIISISDISTWYQDLFVLDDYN